MRIFDFLYFSIHWHTDIRKDELIYVESFGNGRFLIEYSNYTFDEPFTYVMDSIDGIKLNELIEALKTDTWESEYYPKNDIILDGYYWDLHLSEEGENLKRFHGENAYPTGLKNIERIINYVKKLSKSDKYKKSE